jgi:hypothetical protein
MILFFTYVLSEILRTITNILPNKVRNILFFLDKKIIENVSLLDIISLLLVLIIILSNTKIVLPHESF